MPFYSRNRKALLLILSFAFLKLLLHFMANSNFGYHRDELLYLALGEHLDWGYKEVPPFIAGISSLSVYLLGDSVFAIRIFSTLFSSAIVFLTGLCALEMGGKRFAIVIACIAVIFSPAFLASGYLLQPVVFDQFFWLICAWLTIRYIKTQKTVPLYWLGAAAGFGMLTKYTIAFFLLALLIGLLFTSQRKLLINKAWWIATAIAFILFLPNLIWQMNNDFPVIRHMNELRETQLNYIKPVDFLIEQLMVHATFSLVWLSGLISLFAMKYLKNYRFLGIAYLVIILLLVLLKGKVYYSFGAYPMLFAAGGIALDQLLSSLSRVLKLAFLSLITVPSLLFLPVVVPILPFQSTLKFFRFTSDELNIRFLVKWEDQEYHATTQDYADMVGWEEMAQHVSKAYYKIPYQDRSQTTIFANNYGQAGAIDHYRKKYGLPQAVCLNSSYALWSPESILTRHIVYIEDEFPNELAPMYKKVVKIAEIKNPYAREKGTSIYLLSYPIKDPMPLYKQVRNQEVK
jgi:hypothetical protein